ncbi:fimbria/pilus outer membrane usher protein [Escherichia fergusonii]|uniref:fimbria/pilus outer membrane usher protein n=1 Tax=Escherichia fergusonii TaxID=564 RepID=UPI001CC129C7|nr:fimbria/pilus outer membrane usher protein [Escherichia fergusonii]MBZ4072408.1 fimbrial biogenesis outer membrane usher protein [Escherichia fergusonii]MBZ4081237.1 fimbrial biogenesis outer membrane usher protein [Escherichia fergusonii]MBZ4084977.1 fimbrial biogenesis outer membrane usher protein [Escherichia fergusonii]MBZ4090502.1 fimbrial biogenesis outer membrane usher protein [Escherichia fergusonii]MBZ4093827.1 fimbrial biogenesis outer membrane usher protein [Escherichia fergusoni
MDTVNIYRLSIIFCLAAVIPSALAVEFNLNVLDKSMRDSIDLSLLKEKNAIAPGEYFVSIVINNNQISSGQKIRWQKAGDQIKACIDSSLMDKFGLKDEVRQSLPIVNNCVDFKSRPEIVFVFDQSNQQLNITIPQAWLAWHSENWTPPSTWNAGVPGVLLDYNLFASTYRPQEGSNNTNLNAYGTAGLNAGAWRLRSDYQLNQSDSGDHRDESAIISRTYLFRPLPQPGARLTLGETDLSSNIFEGFSYTGAALTSDDRMLPWELRGYAPQISGIAQTNATVTISHNGRVIYQKKVPPGPFIVDDLNQSVQGTLDVKVTEEDGRVNSFQISAASTPFLTRQGQVRYKLAAGRPRASMSHHTENETFLSSEASWGVLSNTSLYGGMLLSGDDYHSGALGIGQNMLWLGALSFDVTWAKSQFNQQEDEQGYSYRVNYSKRIDATDSLLSLAAYRFSDRQFHSYANYIDHKYNDADTHDEKQTISISASQPITPLNLNLNVNLLRQTWWNADTTTTANITAGFNVDIGDWKDISVSTSFNTTHYEDKKRDNQIYFSISLPVGEGGRLGYDLQNSSNTTTHRMSWNDTLDEHNSWGMSAGLQSDRPDNGAQVSGNYQHLSSVGEWDLTGTYATNDYTSASSSWSGSFTATQYGAAFHRRSSTNEPRLMVSTDGVANIPVQGNLDYTNHFGIAMVPFVASYQPSTVAINMNNLPEGVTVSENVVKETWIEGAIGFKSMASRSGKDLSVIIRQASGQFPPLGADIQQTTRGVSVGMVSEDGHAWLSGVDENQQFTVLWGDNRSCTIHLPERLEDTSKRLILPCH